MSPLKIWGGGEGIRMSSRTIRLLGLLLVMRLLTSDELALGHAEQVPAAAVTLPRSFQGARLGMLQSDLMNMVPEAERGSLGTNGRKQGTLAVPLKDRFIDHIEYRIYRGALRELAIYYKRDRVPRGYEGLLGRLKESYGQPATENLEEYDPRPDVFFVKKTVWKDATTISVLAETRKLREGQEIHDLVLTITDRSLQEAFEQDEARRRRQQELSIPIPEAARELRPNRTAHPGVEGPPMLRNRARG